MTHPQPDAHKKPSLIQKSPLDESPLNALLSDGPRPNAERGVQPRPPLPSPASVDADKVAAALAFALGRPQVTTHAPLASALLEYCDHTIPHFNKSAFCARACEAALEAAYPDLWKLFCAQAMTTPRFAKLVRRQGLRR